MTSKNLFFKLMKEDLKRRIWAIALLGLGFFFFYPVVAAFMAGEIKDYIDYAKGLKEYTEDLSRWLSFNCGLTVFLMMVSALICGLSSFSFLNSKSKVDFYHAIPVRREKLYVVNFLDGILILAVPYGIFLALAVAVGIVNGADPGTLCKVAAAAYSLHLTYYILMYTLVIVAAMLTGHLVVCFLGTMVLTFYVPLAVVLVNVYFSLFFQTFDESHFFMQQWARISPVVEYIYQVMKYSDNEFFFWDPLKAWAVSLVLAAAGGFLYQKRPSEAAGKAMSFSVSRPIIRILLVMVSTIGLGVFFWSIRRSLGWAVFGILCGGIICHCVVEIIYNFDFKKLFSHKIQLAVCLLLSCAFFVVCRFDLLGYDRYLPRESQVKEASIRISALNDWVSYGSTRIDENGDYYWQGTYENEYILENMHYQDVGNLLDIALEGVSQTKERRNRNDDYYGYGSRYWGWDDEPEEQSWLDSRVYICYLMKNGRKVYRTYYIRFDEKMRPAMERLYGDETYQKGTFPVLNLMADQVAAIRYRGQYDKEIYLAKMSDAEKQRFLETFQREFAGLTLEKMEQEAPIGLIRFAEILDEEAERRMWGEEGNLTDKYEYYDEGDYYEYASSHSRYGYGSRENFYPVYPSFTETLACLNERGIKTDGYTSSLDVKGIYIYRETEDEEGNWKTQYYRTEDPKEVARLKAIAMVERLCYYDPLFQREDMEGELMIWKTGSEMKESVRSREDAEETEYWNLPVVFPKGEVPQEVWDGLK